jgi:hypothetical protein
MRSAEVGKAWCLALTQQKCRLRGGIHPWTYQSFIFPSKPCAVVIFPIRPYALRFAGDCEQASKSWLYRALEPSFSSLLATSAEYIPTDNLHHSPNMHAAPMDNDPYYTRMEDLLLRVTELHRSQVALLARKYLQSFTASPS